MVTEIGMTRTHNADINNRRYLERDITCIRASDLITLVCSVFDDRSLPSLACTSQFAFQTVTRLLSCSFFSRLRVTSLTGIDVGQKQQHLCKEIYVILTSKTENSQTSAQSALIEGLSCCGPFGNVDANLILSRGSTEISRALVPLLLNTTALVGITRNYLMLYQLLSMASAVGHTSVVRTLIESGLDPSTSNNIALSTAAMQNHPCLVELLLSDRRVDPRAGNDYALWIARTNGYQEVVQVVQRRIAAA